MSGKKEWLRECLSWMFDVATISGRVATLVCIPIGATAATFCEELRIGTGAASTFIFERAGGFVAGSLFGGAVVASTSISGDIVGGDLVYFKNEMSNTALERRADQLYGVLHRDYKNMQRKPLLIAESQKAMEVTSRMLDITYGESIMDKLCMFEALLKNASIVAE